MHRLTRVLRRPRRTEDGAAAVEFALLVPIFLTIVIGMMSAGIALNKQINITQSARETSRYGATLTIAAAGGTIGDWLSNVSAVGQASGGPAVHPIGGQDGLCVAMIDTSTTPVTASHMIDNNGTVVTGQCPGTDINPELGPKYVQVAMFRKANFFAIFISPQLNLKAQAVSPYEPGNAP